MILGWKKSASKSAKRIPKKESDSLRKLRLSASSTGSIGFDRVSLGSSIHNLSLQIQPGSWVLLYGEDDFAKALFCDLCFSYIFAESGTVAPSLKGTDVSFLGRSSTTYGITLLDHLRSGVQENSRDHIEFAVSKVLSPRFSRHLKQGSLEFLANLTAQDAELDERDLMEISEANMLLQRRPAAVIDTTSDFYRIALEQGFRHSEAFLNSGKILIWILHDRQPLPGDATYWALPRYNEIKKHSLSFPTLAPTGFLN